MKIDLEQELVPKMILEYWPELDYVKSPSPNWYGFFYATRSAYVRSYPAVLRLSIGYIHIIDQEHEYPSDEYKEIDISIGDPNFEKYVPVINDRINFLCSKERKATMKQMWKVKFTSLISSDSVEFVIPRNGNEDMLDSLPRFYQKFIDEGKDPSQYMPVSDPELVEQTETYPRK